MGYYHPHNLRRFHASTIEEFDLANALEGRKPSVIREAYFKNNPERLREEYKKQVSKLSLLDTRLVTI